MKIDYNLDAHYEPIDGHIEQCGYTIRFNTPRIIRHMKKTYDCDVVKGILYRFTSPYMFREFHENLSTRDTKFLGLIGDDSWALWALKWGWETEEHIRKEHPLIGKELWDSATDIEIKI